MSSLPTPKFPISASPKDLIRFLVWKDSKGKTKIHVQAVLILALIPSGNVAALLDWPLVQLIAQLGNCVPFLILLAGLTSGQGYLLVTLQLIRLSRNTSLPSPRNNQKQGSPLAKPYLFSSTSSLNGAPTFVSGHFFHPYPPWKGTSRAVIWLSSASISTPVTEHLTSAAFILKRFSCFLESKAYCFTTSSGKRFEERTPISSLLRNTLMTA